jgi:gliding motility-associated-like protein
MDFCYLTGLTVTPNNEVEISWIWDTDTDFASAQLLRDSTPVFSPTNASQLQNNYLDATANVNAQSHNYKIKSTDACGFELQSPEGKTIFLQARADAGYINRLHWSNLELQNTTIQEYQIYRVLNGNAQRIGITTDTSYNDALDISQNSQANACYYVVANAILQLPQRARRFVQSRSNSVCLLQNAAVQFPNAFAPNGHNRVFKPVLVFGRSLQDYQLEIFDRYGQQIFSSSDIFIGWDGRHKEQAAPQGVYVYRVQYKQPDGQQQQQQGTVMLLR